MVAEDKQTNIEKKSTHGLSEMVKLNEAKQNGYFLGSSIHNTNNVNKMEKKLHRVQCTHTFTIDDVYNYG